MFFAVAVVGVDDKRGKSGGKTLTRSSHFSSFPSLSLERLQYNGVRPQVLPLGLAHDDRGALAIARRGLDLGHAQRRDDGEEEG